MLSLMYFDEMGERIARQIATWTRNARAVAAPFVPGDTHREVEENAWEMARKKFDGFSYPDNLCYIVTQAAESAAFPAVAFIGGDPTSEVVYARTEEVHFLSMEEVEMEKKLFFGLQELVRANLISKLFLVSWAEVEKTLADDASGDYDDVIISQVSSILAGVFSLREKTPKKASKGVRNSPANLITLGAIDPKTGSESLLYPLENPREMWRYYVVSEENDSIKRVREIRNEIKNMASENCRVDYSIYRGDYDIVYVEHKSSQLQEANRLELF